MVRKWGAMYYLRKFGGFSMVALLAVVPSLAVANTIVTSQTYVDMQDALDEKLSNKLNGTATTGQKIGDLAAGSAAGQDQVMYPSAAAVKEYAVKIAQGTGTNNANVGKALVVGNDGNVTLGNAGQTYTASDGVALTGTNFTNSGVRSVATGSTAGTVSVNTNGTAAEVAVAGWTNKVDVAQGVGTNNANVGKGLIVNSSGNLALANILQAIGTPTNSITANDGYVVKNVAVNADGKTIDVTRDTVKIPVAAGAPSSNTPTAFAEVWVQ